MPMKNLCHPGELILHDWIGGLNLTVEAAAEHMQVSAESLEDICQGKAPVTTEMAVRLSKALGSTPRVLDPTTGQLRRLPGRANARPLQHQADRTGRLTMPMYDPPHPGEAVLGLCL